MKWIRYVVVLLLVGSCIEPFSLTPGENGDYVVVFGRISDQPGPYTVTITRQQSLDGKREPDAVKAARVRIVDDAGFTDVLTEIGNGQYVTDSLTGSVGRSYKLHIRTAENEVYESNFEKLISVGSLSNLRKEFLLAVDSLDFDRRVYSNGFNIFLDAEFTPEQEGRALWKWSAVYTYTTDPLHAGYVYGARTFVRDPPPCTGYRGVDIRPGRPITAGDTGRFQIEPITIPPKPCSCCTCWHTIHNDNLILSDEATVTGNVIKDMNLVFLPVGYLYFQTKFLMTVEQQSLSPSAYAFYKQAKILNDTGSDLFQTAPHNVTGNIYATQANGRKVLGIFSVGSTRTDTISMVRRSIPYTIDPPLPYSTLPCQNYFPTETTNIKPKFF